MITSNNLLEQPGRHDGVSCSYVLPAAPPLSLPVRPLKTEWILRDNG
jgi:hypothetical protein